MDFSTPDWVPVPLPLHQSSFIMQQMPTYRQWPSVPTPQFPPRPPYFTNQGYPVAPSPPPTQYTASSPSISEASLNPDHRAASCALSRSQSHNFPDVQRHHEQSHTGISHNHSSSRHPNAHPKPAVSDAAQRQHIYPDRRRKKRAELQHEIQELKTQSWQLEQTNQKLPRDLEARWQRVLLELKSEVEGSGLDAAHQEAIGWMLKHGYGTNDADDALFSVFSVNEPPGGLKPECTIC